MSCSSPKNNNYCQKSEINFMKILLHHKLLNNNER